MYIILLIDMISSIFSNFRQISSFSEKDNILGTQNSDYLNNSLECSYFSDCFNCSSYSYKNCIWSNNKCIDSNISLNNEITTSDSLPSLDNLDLNKMEECLEILIEDEIKNYCGKNTFTFDGNNLNHLIPKNFYNFYYLPNILCKFKISIENKDKFEIEIDQNYYSEKFNYIYLNIFYSNSNTPEESRKITYKTEDILLENAKLIEIYYFSSYNFLNSPIKIKLNKENNKISIGIIILIVILCLIIIACMILIVYSFSHKKLDSNNNSPNISIDENVNENDKDSKKDLNIKKKKNNNVISNINYDELKKIINLNCSICNDNFDNNKKISIIKCSHIFHKDCLDEYIKDNINNNKETKLNCPKCKKEF